jgi:hypothetical protein
MKNDSSTIILEVSLKLACSSGLTQKLCMHQ